MLAAIPYTTFPEVDIGPVSLKTFGLMLALGAIAAITIVARRGERIGVPTDEVISVGTRMVVAGVIGARLTWVATHLDTIDSPVDVIAVWEGGLQYSGGFIAAIAVGLPMWLRWERLIRWKMMDNIVFGLVVGIAFGRVGCYAVGEHFGGETNFFLANRYDGGVTREGPPALGATFHNTALYELLSCIVLALVLWWLLERRKAPISIAGATFLAWYGITRFSTDTVRLYDERVLGLTGMQWTCLTLIPVFLWVVLWVRPRINRLAEERAAEQQAADIDTTDQDTTEEPLDEPEEPTPTRPGRAGA